MIGKTLGHYRVGEPLGRGGMGEVYVADDLNLNRKVALKFLPDAFAGDPERMARFEREAKLLASLNHPNIAAIHGLEQADGKRFIVMELVEGESLAQRLSKGALPVEKALGICRQIADGLEAAHEKGVIHRDLKPANVMIAEGEKVKILDFGLAKALADEAQNVDSSHSPTLTEAMTRPGVILGTAAYMSPEQAKGKTVDKRADIWAFGCILYECLTGKRAFEGETVTETLAAILKAEPDWQALPATIPQGIRMVLRRCLEKNLGGRFHCVPDLRIGIEEARAIGETAMPFKRRSLWLAWAATAVLLLAASAFAWLWFTRRAPSDEHAVKLSLVPPEKASFNSFAISPDGRWLAFCASAGGRDQLWVRALDALESRALPGTEDASAPVWSPDSRSIAFFDGYQVKRIEISGGPVQVICGESQFWEGSWNRKGEIIYNGPTLGLEKVTAAEGKVSVLTSVDTTRQESAQMSPSFLPDGRHFVYYVSSLQKDIEGIYLGSLEGDVKRRLMKDAMQPLYASTGPVNPGYLLFKRGEALMAQPFDSRQLKPVGEPLLVADHAGRYSASDTGVLVIGETSPLDPGSRPYIWVDRSGRRINSLGVDAGYGDPDLSPDGKRFAADRINFDFSTDIWLCDALNGRSSRFTFNPALDVRPIWSPDGSRIIFASNRDGNANNLYQKQTSAAGDEELLLKTSEPKVPTCWSSDGRYLIYYVLDPKTGSDIWVLPLEGERKAFSFLKTEASETAGQLSPDGKWLAYQSDESGRDEIYVQSFPTFGSKRQISANGGIKPRWRKDGKELFYYGEGKLIAAQVKTIDAKEIDFDPGVHLFDYPAIGFRLYAASADGQRFLITQFEKQAATPLTVILNWTASLKK